MWGTPEERERKRRIDIAAWAYAYEIDNDPLVDDATFDRECELVNLSIRTGNKKLDDYFCKHFQPHTGQWIHKHPNKSGIAHIVELKRKGKRMSEDALFGPGEQKLLAAKIKDDIDAYTAAIYDDGHRKHLGGSMIGDECSRKLWYSFRWCLTPDFVNTKGEDHKGRLMRLFNRGHKEEDRFVEWLRGMGFEVEEVDPETGKQFRISDVNGHFGGSLDGRVKLPAQYGNLPMMLLEFKTSSDRYFTKLVQNGVKVEKPVHFVQMSTYGEKYTLKYALYMAVNKNTDEIYVEVVELDWEVGRRSIIKAGQIIGAQTPPPKLSENSAYFSCKFCDFASICHGQASYEKSCRSCKFASAVEDKQWRCEHFGVIPDEFIAKGCDSWQEAR